MLTSTENDGFPLRKGANRTVDFAVCVPGAQIITHLGGRPQPRLAFFLAIPMYVPMFGISGSSFSACFRSVSASLYFFR